MNRRPARRWPQRAWPSAEPSRGACAPLPAGRARWTPCWERTWGRSSPPGTRRAPSRLPPPPPAARVIRDDWPPRQEDSTAALTIPAGGWQTALSNYADLSAAEKAALPAAAFVETLAEALDLSPHHPTVTFA